MLSISYFIWPFKLFWIRASLVSLLYTIRASSLNTKFNPGIYDEFIYNHWVDVTAGVVLIPRGYHQLSSQHVLTWITIDMVIFINKLFTKFLIFWNTKAFLSQEKITLAVFGKTFKNLGPQCSSTSYFIWRKYKI